MPLTRAGSISQSSIQKLTPAVRRDRNRKGTTMRARTHTLITVPWRTGALLALRSIPGGTSRDMMSSDTSKMRFMVLSSQMSGDGNGQKAVAPQRLSTCRSLLRDWIKAHQVLSSIDLLYIPASSATLVEFCRRFARHTNRSRCFIDGFAMFLETLQLSCNYDLLVAVKLRRIY